jgi:hypothetical protein
MLVERQSKVAGRAATLAILLLAIGVTQSQRAAAAPQTACQGVAQQVASVCNALPGTLRPILPTSICLGKIVQCVNTSPSDEFADACADQGGTYTLAGGAPGAIQSILNLLGLGGTEVWTETCTLP